MRICVLLLITIAISVTALGQSDAVHKSVKVGGGAFGDQGFASGGVTIDSAGNIQAAGTITGTISGTINPANPLVIDGTNGSKLFLNSTNSAISSGNPLGEVRFTGDDDGSELIGAEIEALADSIWSTGDQPTRVEVRVTPDGSGSPVLVQTWEANGDAIFEFMVGIKDTSPSFDLDVNGTFRATGTGQFDGDLDVDGAISTTSGNTEINSSADVLFNPTGANVIVMEFIQLAVGRNDAGFPSAEMELAKTNAAPDLYIHRADTAITANNGLGQIIFSGDDSGDHLSGVILRGEAAENWTGSSSPGRLEVLITPTGSTTPVLALTLHDNKDLELEGALATSTINNFGDGDTTPTVDGASLFKLGAQTTTVNITSLDDGRTGQIITLIAIDGNTALIDGGNLKLAGNWTPDADDALRLQFDGSNWFQLAPPSAN